MTRRLLLAISTLGVLLLVGAPPALTQTPAQEEPVIEEQTEEGTEEGKKGRKKKSKKSSEDEPAADGEEAVEEEAPSDPASMALPGKHHEHLAFLVGDWDYEMQVWNSPGAEPMTATGEAEAHQILGGRFVEVTYRGELMGAAYEARSIDGYDNWAKEYTSIWQDTMGTYTLIFEGRCSEEGTVRTMTSTLTDPVSDRKLRLRLVTTAVDPDTYRYESFIVLGDEAEPFKNMELLAHRRAD